jgi:hypothetical protein
MDALPFITLPRRELPVKVQAIQFTLSYQSKSVTDESEMYKLIINSQITGILSISHAMSNMAVSCTS